MYYWDRQFINERLRLTRRQSYRLIPATPSGRIRSDSVVLLLNRSRVGIGDPLPGEIPSDLLTPEEAVARFGVTLAELRRWSRRTLKVLPHFRLNKHTIRFSAKRLEQWLMKNAVAA